MSQLNPEPENPEPGQAERDRLGAAECALAAALRWLGAGRRVAVGTVMTATGEASHRPGCVFVVAEDGSLAGVEAGDFLVAEALRAIEDGEQRILVRTVAAGVAGHRGGREPGGRVETYLEPLDPGSGGHRLLERVAKAQADGVSVALVSDLVTGMKTLVYPDAVHGGFGLYGPELDEVRRFLAAGRTLVFEPYEDLRLFVHSFGIFGNNGAGMTIGT